MQFLYGDHLEATGTLEVLGLMYLGNKYDVQSLLSKCDENLLPKLDPDNCLDLHQASKVHERQDLALKIEDYISKYDLLFNPFPI